MAETSFAVATRFASNTGNGGAQVRSGNARVAVPRVGPPPQRYDANYTATSTAATTAGGPSTADTPTTAARNIYIVPYGRTYSYYPRYYYNPYAFGYGPAGRGHFYFDLHYNSYIWHPYSVYRNGQLWQLRVSRRRTAAEGSPARRAGVHRRLLRGPRGRLRRRLPVAAARGRRVPGRDRVPGYQPLAFDVRIFPGEKTTYEGDLLPE